MGSGDERVTLTEDGELAAGAAVELLKKIDNPMELDPPSYSIALDLLISGEHQWMFMTTGPDSGGGAGQPVGEHPDQTFEEWVDDQVAAAEDGRGKRGGSRQIARTAVRGRSPAAAAVAASRRAAAATTAPAARGVSR